MRQFICINLANQEEMRAFAFNLTAEIPPAATVPASADQIVQTFTISVSGDADAGQFFLGQRDSRMLRENRGPGLGGFHLARIGHVTIVVAILGG